MGSVQSFETPKCRGGQPGKIDAPLNKKLSEVKWGEFTICDLFNKVNVKSLKYKTSDLPNEATAEFNLPALTAGIQNQGLNNYVPKADATVLKNVISISANGANTGATFYQSNEFTVLQDAYAIDWSQGDTLTDNSYLFLTATVSKAIYGNYEWTNKAGWERIKFEKIHLPITENDKIDFAFMENFIAELEAERIKELEAYLTVAGLKNYELTDEEHKALEDYNNLSFKNYSVPKLFEIKNTGNILSKDIVKNSGEYPYLCASADNNAVSTYISYDKKYMDKGNCIFIGGKTFVVTYQEKDFFSNDSHNLTLRLKDELKRCKDIQLYMATCIKKSLGHRYSWGDSISNKKIKDDVISLPSLGEFIDYDSMPILISAIKKLVIRDVVLFADRKIGMAKKIVNK